MNHLERAFKTIQDRSGNPLYWSDALDGLPYVGNPNLNLRREELAKLPRRSEAHARIFDLPKEMDDYLAVIGRCANSAAQTEQHCVLREDKQLGWDQETKTLQRWVSWLEVFVDAEPV